MPSTRLSDPRHLACLLLATALGCIGGGAARADTGTTAPATAWTESVHAAFARQAHEAVLAAHHVFIQSGLASWYGREFAGRRTSSGVRFDPMQLTCAHRTLPLGTRLRVTSQDTGRSVVVTVIDRGPYAGPARVIDLSRAAAARLGMVRQGLNNVTLERMIPASDVEVAEAAGADSSEQAVAAAAR